jgi:hypothetical protein
MGARFRLLGALSVFGNFGALILGSSVLHLRILLANSTRPPEITSLKVTGTTCPLVSLSWTGPASSTFAGSSSGVRRYQFHPRCGVC